MGSFEHNYSWWPDKFLAVTLDGHDYAIYTPTYSSIAVMKLPECEEVFRMTKEWWSQDDCPLAFYAHPHLPGLVVVVWVYWGMEHDELISYFWLSPDGKIKAEPRGRWLTTKWRSGDPPEKFFEIRDLSHYEEKVEGTRWEGHLVFKTEEREFFGDVIPERERLVGPMPTEEIYDE